MTEKRLNYLAVPIEQNGHHYNQLKPYHALFGGIQVLARQDQSTFNLCMLINPECISAMDRRHAASRGVADWVQRINVTFDNAYSSMQYPVCGDLPLSELMLQDPRFVCEELGKVKGAHPLTSSPFFDRAGRVASLFRTHFMGNACRIHEAMRARQ